MCRGEDFDLRGFWYQSLAPPSTPHITKGQRADVTKLEHCNPLRSRGSSVQEDSVLTPLTVSGRAPSPPIKTHPASPPAHLSPQALKNPPEAWMERTGATHHQVASFAPPPVSVSSVWLFLFLNTRRSMTLTLFAGTWRGCPQNPQGWQLTIPSCFHSAEHPSESKHCAVWDTALLSDKPRGPGDGSSLPSLPSASALAADRSAGGRRSRSAGHRDAP